MIFLLIIGAVAIFLVSTYKKPVVATKPYSEPLEPMPINWLKSKMVAPVVKAPEPLKPLLVVSKPVKPIIKPVSTFVR